MQISAQQELEAVGRRLAVRGYQFKVRAFFGDTGIYVHTPAEHVDGITVIAHAVFLHQLGSEWEARITPHGGPHWTCRTADVAALEQIALQALQSDVYPPSDDWQATA